MNDTSINAAGQAFAIGIEALRADAENLQNESDATLPKQDSPEFKIGYTFGELENLKLPARAEIIKGLGRGENGLLNAVTNVGKSTLMRNLAVCLITGKPFPPLTEGGARYRVVVIDSEDSLSFLRYDIQKMIADFTPDEQRLIRENLLLICDLKFGDEDLQLNQKEHFLRLADRINNFRADFIFVDTVSSSFAIRSENDNAEIKESVMKPLKRLARLADAGVLASHHIGKAKSEDGGTRENAHKGRGASVFSDLSRVVFNLEKEATGDVVLSCAKLKGERFADARMQYDPTHRWLSMQGEIKTVSNYGNILDLFAGGQSFKRSQIDEMLDGEMSKATITRNLTAAVERGDLIRQRGIYSKNAHMLTPYSDEHMSINEDSFIRTDTELCPDCESELEQQANSELLCNVCLYSK